VITALLVPFGINKVVPISGSWSAFGQQFCVSEEAVMAVISRALSESERVAGPRSVAVETLYIQSLNPVWLRPLP